MKNKLLFVIICFTIFSLRLFAQETIKPMNFILKINDVIPENGIFEGFFLIKDSTGKVLKNQFPFTYRVGYLNVIGENYDKLFFKTRNSRVFMQFKQKDIEHGYMEIPYEFEIPAAFINKEYIICSVYDVALRENKLKYDFRGKKRIFNINVPGAYFGALMWEKVVKNKIRLNQY